MVSGATVARQLIYNTLLSGAGLFWITVFGLLIVPVIIATWGVAALGLIVLARLLLPTGLLALFDFGVSEVTTQIVARAQVSADWNDAGARVLFLLTVAAGIGVVLALALFATAPLLVKLFNVQPEFQESFERIIRISALANLLFMPTLIAEGVIKGFEKYTLLRAFDVLAAAVYVGATLAASKLGTTYEAVPIIYIATSAARAVSCLYAARFALEVQGHPHLPRRP